jgi:hypothetical protein
VIESKLKASVFWELTKYLSKETDYAAWYPMFKALEYMSNMFLFSKYKSYIADIKVINYIIDDNGVIIK